MVAVEAELQSDTTKINLTLALNHHALETLHYVRNVYYSPEASLRIREQGLAIKHGATKWLSFWLDPKLSSKTHFTKRLMSAKGALQRIKGFGGSHGGLPMRLVRRVVVAAVNSIALYGGEV
jgi:hypothetical protein